MCRFRRDVFDEVSRGWLVAIHKAQKGGGGVRQTTEKGAESKYENIRKCGEKWTIFAISN